MPEMPNVIPLEPVDDAWGNKIRDRTIQRYTSISQRSSLHPSPTAGDMAYLSDSGAVEVYHSGAWRSMLPTGSLIPFAGSTPPTGFLVCNGSAVSRTTYAALFAVIGSVYGAGDGTTTFNLPDLRGRFPFGTAASGTGSTLGSTAGNLLHTHAGGSHAHTMGTHLHTVGSHNHDVNPPEQPTTSDGGHIHGMGTHAHSVSDSTGGPSGTQGTAGGAAFSASSSHTHSFSGSTGSADPGNTATAGAHAHTFNMGIITSTSDGAGNTSTVDPGDTAAGGTAAGGNNSQAPPLIALTFIIRT